MLCPIDGSELSAALVNGYQIHRCVRCTGVSINANLLREVRAYAALDMHRRPNVEAGNLNCPADGMPMKMLVYKGIAMDVCPRCFGLWMEVRQLVSLLKLAGPPKHADLSKIGQQLPTLRSSAGTNDVEGWGEILDLSAEVIDAIGKLAD